jgi:hypothetical protein
MALRNIISKAFLPNFEHDLSRSVASELASVGHMVDNMLAPEAFAYSSAGSVSAGVFQKTAMRKSPVSDRFVKVYYPAKCEGMFKDREMGHGTILNSKN